MQSSISVCSFYRNQIGEQPWRAIEFRGDSSFVFEPFVPCGGGGYGVRRRQSTGRVLPSQRMTAREKTTLVVGVMLQQHWIVQWTTTVHISHTHTLSCFYRNTELPSALVEVPLVISTSVRLLFANLFANLWLLALLHWSFGVMPMMHFLIQFNSIQHHLITSLNCRCRSQWRKGSCQVWKARSSMPAASSWVQGLPWIAKCPWLCQGSLLWNSRFVQSHGHGFVGTLLGRSIQQVRT